MSESTAIRLAQALGITSAAMLTASVASISIFVIPVLVSLPTPLAVRLWSETYERGKAIAPPMAVLSASCFTYLAYQLRDVPAASTNSLLSASSLYGGAAVALLSIMPYTLLVIFPTNQKLQVKEAEMKALGSKDEVVEVGETVKDLIHTWGLLNFGRCMTPLVGALLGLWATFA